MPAKAKSHSFYMYCNSIYAILALIKYERRVPWDCLEDQILAQSPLKGKR